MRNVQIDVALRRALAFLSNQQLDDGELATYVDTSAALGPSAILDSTPYTTAQVAYSLRFGGHAFRPIVDRALHFLRDHMDPAGIWRYWTRKHPHPFALTPDCDTTALCAAALAGAGHALPASTKDIILCGLRDDGRFYCWLHPRTPAQKALWARYGAEVDRRAITFLTMAKAIDAVCNVVMANVVWYLGATPETDKAIAHLAHVATTSLDAVQGPSWPDGDYFGYALSRALASGVDGLRPASASLETDARRRADAETTSAMSRALAVSTLLNLGLDESAVDDGLRYILSAQADDGSWPAVPWFIGPPPLGSRGPRDQIGYYGSAEITTALCVEALARVRR